jgi:hypothetical protein
MARTTWRRWLLGAVLMWAVYLVLSFVFFLDAAKILDGPERITWTHRFVMFTVVYAVLFVYGQYVHPLLFDEKA